MVGIPTLHERISRGGRLCFRRRHYSGQADDIILQVIISNDGKSMLVLHKHIYIIITFLILFQLAVCLLTVHMNIVVFIITMSIYCPHDYQRNENIYIRAHI